MNPDPMAVQHKPCDCCMLIPFGCADLVLLRRPMGGALTSQRNVACWDEALEAAKKHKDIHLEARVCKAMGGVAKQYG